MTDSAPVDGEPTAATPPVAPQDASEAPPATLWERMRDDPQYAPEHLALEAVRRLGPEAAQWVARQRATRPGISADELADQAVRRFVNRARLSGAVSGAAGLPGAVVDVGVLAWTQARLVLHVAAAYGVDPVHPDRATDLLVLQKVHKVAESARLALGVAAGRERAGALFGAAGDRSLGRAMLQLGVRLAQMAGVRAAKRIAAKVVPGAAIVLGTWANSSATKDLAERARARYRTRADGLPEQRHP
ncbi:MAG: EcsC family protein [Micromonospora sp.]